ncbi:penicillin-binding transpeptidase domain-containing protein [Paenibacillus sp. H1-7]|uniref:penicillin-binding transpeptidase domain-containing protein n=1 Tax=Paenibacillus sp. H1-7 TaxID=2282849 RepID=UPI001EF7897F|nr:penicillin-binding transpeptidase domain-containing protein [Paenibacillus sp. H1-7]
MKKNPIAAWSRLFALVCVLTALAGCKHNEPVPEEAMRAFTDAWQQKRYEAMYDWLTAETKQKIAQEAFVTRHKAIYEGIGMSGFALDWQPVEQDPNSRELKDRKSYTLHVKMDTTYGPVAYDQTALVMKEEGNWRIQWDSTYIHPKLGDKDKVRVEETRPERGEILDREGFGLAVNAEKLEVGIIPKKLPEQSDEAIAKLAELLKLNPKDIQAQLKATWVKPDYFVPVTIVPEGDNRLEALAAIPGVTYRKKKVRSYPLEEAAAHMVGYIGKINQEELTKYKDKGYGTDDWIGKAGLELSLESKLRGTAGGRIYIVDADGKEKATLAKRDAVNGETVKLTIDSHLQSMMYQQLAQDSGAASAIHPMTGEVLALVSAPSYNPNFFISGVTAEQWKQWNEDPNKPLLNRFARAYAPGSAFKPITAAIALQENLLDPNAEKTIEGKQWKKDSSWGNYYVTRVSSSQSAVNLSKAMMYSDNIYFAQVALDMGEQKFMKDAGQFGFGEKLSLPLAFDTSSLSNTPKMKNDVQLADSGYGQGEVVMNALHVATTYTVFTNGGTMLKPTLILSEGSKPEPWKSGLLRPDVVQTVTDKMVEVIENPAGTGHSAMINGIKLAGKTGTAELKQKKDTAGQENGWFVAFNTDNPRLLVALMVENVQDHGGSRYLSGKISSIFTYYVKK